MAGILDWLNGGTQAQPMTPQQMGLLGMAGSLSDAFTPQAASRLPTAKPNAAYLLTRAAGGYGGGYKVGVDLQGQQIKNASDLNAYNFWAQMTGQPPMGGAPGNPAGGGTPAPMPGAAAPVPGAPAGPMPQAAQGGLPSASAMPGPQVAGNPGAPIGGPAPLPGAGLPAPKSPGQPDMMTLLSTMPPPVLQHFGIQVPPELTAAFYAGIKPGTPEYQTIVQNVAIKASGVAPTIGGERPGVVAQNYDLASRTYQPQQGAFDTMYRGAQTQAAGAGAGGLPSKEAESAFNAGLKVRTDNTVARNAAFYQTGQMPPDALGGAASAPITGPTGKIATPSGTVVPPMPAAPPFQGTDAIVRQNANTEATEKNFGAMRGTLDGTESRMVGLARALQIVQAGGLNEHRAEIANLISGAGMPDLAAKIMAAKDVAAVQTAMGLQTIDVLGQLKQINQGTGGRILNSEFTSLVDKEYSPDLSPQANYDLVTQALGGVYQTKRMIDDYYSVAKPAGWGRDANAYVSAWQSQPENSYQTMVDRAGKTIGPLKGQFPTPPTDAVKHLQMNPALAPQFDAKYGQGASQQYIKAPNGR